LAFALIRAAWAGESFAFVLLLSGELFDLDLVDPVFHRVLTLLW